nr:phage major tail tube protein [Xylella fastidiosa]
MSAPRHLLKHLNLFIDGKGYAGQVEEINLPKLTLKTEEFRGGGMLAPVELTMGLEKLEPMSA